MGPHETKSFCISKEITERGKMKPTERKKTFASQTFVGEFTPRTQKESKNQKLKATTDLILKWAMDLNGDFTKEEI